MMAGVAYVVGAPSVRVQKQDAGMISLQVVPGGNTDLIMPVFS